MLCDESGVVILPANEAEAEARRASRFEPTRAIRGGVPVMLVDDVNIAALSLATAFFFVELVVERTDDVAVAIFENDTDDARYRHPASSAVVAAIPSASASSTTGPPSHPTRRST